MGSCKSHVTSASNGTPTAPLKQALYFYESIVITSIFKYFPPRLEFFNNFLVRASNRYSLNDPFEAAPTHNYWADLCLQTRYQRFGDTKDQIISYLQSQPENSVWAELGISLYRENGIISFTETKDNLLMWAHYANQHQGVVVEFDTSNNFFSHGSSNDEKLQRVLYRKERLKECTDFLMEPYFHKSDEWSYEKEHRLLVSLYSASKYLIHKNQVSELIESQHFYKDELIDFNDQFKQVKEIGNITSNSSIMAMFELPKESIKSVTFGCRATKSFKENAVKNLQKQGLSDIKIFDAQMDNYDYRLRFIETEI